MTEPRNRAKRPGLQRDFVVSCLIVLGLNFVVIGPFNGRAERTPRTQTYQAALRQLRDVPAGRDVRLAILGDSRSMGLSADGVCAGLGPASPAGADAAQDAAPVCLNLSSVGGEWASIYSLSQALEPYLAEDALIVVGVSDYWLEAGNASRLELLPEATAYAELGQPELALASFFPMSVNRASRMNHVHDWLAEAARWLERAVGAKPAEDTRAHALLEYQRRFRANVDQWFTPVSDATRAEHVELARRTFAQLDRLGARVVLLYMPNAAARDAWVDENHPGRRARFHATLRALADAEGLALIDLSGELGEIERYKDFHHLKRDQMEEVGALLAARLREVVRDD